MTGIRNRWKLMSKNRAAKEEQGTRRKLDDYETPPENLHPRLTDHYTLKGPFLEPACGSGRLVRALKQAYPKAKVLGTDIKDGHNFAERTKRFPGAIVSNPPYRDGLADVFVRKALELADGQVAMLLQSGFLWGSRREEWLYSKCPPDLVLILPYRIYFFEGPKGKPIPAQYFTHAWYCWPDRATREKGGYETIVKWAPAVEEPDFG